MAVARPAWLLTAGGIFCEADAGGWACRGKASRNDVSDHHPLRLGNRLYTSYWLAGFFILDIEDITKSKLVSGMDWSPSYPCPMHTALPLPFDIRGRRYMVGADEDVVRGEADPPAFIVDDRHHRRTPPCAHWQLAG